MNFWHMQLHPNNAEPMEKAEIVSLLEQEGIIGMGAGWENDRGQPQKFREEVAVGDVVLIRSHGSPLAMVRVTSDCSPNADKALAWFEIVREVEIIALDEQDQIKHQYKEATGKIWTDGIYAATTFESANNYDFLKYWYHQTSLKYIMSSIRLSEKRKTALRQMWADFQATYSEQDRAALQQELGQVEAQWAPYRERIAAGTLALEDYTNRKPKDYLCNFLERDSKIIYGSAKPGNANNFEIKLNSDGETYTFRKNLEKGDRETHQSREEARQRFQETIKPLLENILAATAYEKISIIEAADYVAKQVLRKMAAIENKADFLYIYSDETIDALHSEFLDSEETRNLGKNYEVRKVANAVFEIDQDDHVASVLLSRFLWKYTHTQALADEDTPNVILYGPPGTGKTYAVKNSLDFLCQGDRSRYEYVQFHPSFTYEDFIEGIKPKGLTPDGNIKFELVDGVFKKFCKKAKANPGKDYYFIVDEINRANLSAVFGETLLCIEKDYRHDGVSGDNLIKTQYAALLEEMIREEETKKELAYHYSNGNAYFGVPKNVFFIGMMNDVDKSIDAFDLALRRRFKWIRKDCDYQVLEEQVKFRNGDEFEERSFHKYIRACRKLNTFITDDLGLGRSYEFGHSFFMKITDIASTKTITVKQLEKLFVLHLQPTLREYLRAIYPESELDDKVEEAKKEFTSTLRRK